MAGANPYVGPRSFVAGETLYGRDREAAELRDLLIAERIVLLYSPSGAGKTSLLQAKLLPAMAAAGFAVQPVIRPGGEPSAASANRFVRASLDSLGAGAAETSLAKFLGRPAGSELVVFDQFEEVLTADPGNRAAKSEFFTQLGEMLRQRNRWALFSMREDYIAGLDPYLKLVPTRFSATYRLDLLDRDRAIECIREPARAAGVDFTQAAAEKLADDLRQDGPYVEPVQLQVVCLRVWGRPRGNSAEIGINDVGGEGDIDTALAAYYADRVAKTASAATPERDIRDWFDHRLISKRGTRVQVLRGQEQQLDDAAIAALVDSHLVRSDHRGAVTWYELAHDRLIAPVQEDNRRWREANLSLLQRQAELWEEQKRPDGALLRGSALAKVEEWAKKNPRLTEAEAAFLAACRAGRKRGRWREAAIGAVTALGCAAIAFGAVAWNEMKHATTAEQLAEENAREATEAQQQAQQEAEKATAAKQQAEQNAAEAARQTKAAQSAQSEAQKEANIATQKGLMASALEVKDSQTDLASLLAIEAYRTATGPRTLNTLILAAQANPRLIGYLQGPHAMRVLFHPDGKYLLTLGQGSPIQVWDPLKRTATAAFGKGDQSLANAVMSADGRTLGALGSSRLEVWDLTKTPPSSITIPTPKQGELIGGDLSPDGRLVAACGGVRTGARWLRVWDARTGAQTAAWDNTPQLRDVVFDRAGSHLAAVDAENIFIYDLQTRLMTSQKSEIDIQSLARDMTGDRLTITGVGSVATPHPRKKGAAARRALDNGQPVSRAIVWDWTKAVGKPFTSPQHTVVRAFVPPKATGVAMIGLDSDNEITVWQDPDHSEQLISGTNTLNQIDAAVVPGLGPVLADGHGALWNTADFSRTDRISPALNTSLAFNKDGSLLATASADGAKIWDVRQGKVARTLGGPRYRAAALAFTPAGDLVATAANTAPFAIQFWNAASGAEQGAALSGPAVLTTAIAFSPDGKWLAAAGADGIVRLWDVARRASLGQTPVKETPAHPYDMRLVFSADGKWLASTSGAAGHLWDTAAIFNPSTQKAAKPVGAGSGNGNAATVAVAFSPDSKQVALTSDTVYLYPMGSPNQFRRPFTVREIANSAMTSDWKTMATVSRTGQLQLWDLAEGFGWGDPIVVSPALAQVAFSPDGKYVAAGGKDGVWLVDITPQHWIDRNCDRAGRNLSLAEWNKYIGANRRYAKTCSQFPAAQGGR